MGYYVSRTVAESVLKKLFLADVTVICGRSKGQIEVGNFTETIHSCD